MRNRCGSSLASHQGQAPIAATNTILLFIERLLMLSMSDQILNIGPWLD
jgi:hypothetical protein